MEKKLTGMISTKAKKTSHHLTPITQLIYSQPTRNNEEDTPLESEEKYFYFNKGNQKPKLCPV
jgi:hypothetical protein